MNIIWGPESIQIYNDGYRVVCGDVHPKALGEDYRVTWASAWPAIGDSFDRAWAGERMFLENQRMFLNRLDGRLEETFFTFSHSPIQDETGRVGGLFHPVTETTPTMLAERRTRALRDLAASLAASADEADVARRTVAVLAQFEFDLAFLLYYAFDPKVGHYALAAHHGIEAGNWATPVRMTRDDVGPWPFAKALDFSGVTDVHDLPSILQGEPCGPYPEPPNHGFVIPIVVPTAEQAPAVIVTAASSRLRLNVDYRSFYDLIGVTVASALASVRAREDERRRAEALAEIDRAKTAFFSNVSHEFRTPLTLMLGPLEDILARSNTLAPADREQLETVQRNSLRLLKLVNTLLDFSRIEAGRVQAFYEPTDLASVTAELASVFRSAIERAGLTLKVECSPLAEPVYLDRDMWEKIVLNLISNALKFTFAGEIEVRLKKADGHVALVVHDTGIGISDEEIPKLFERFHRVAGTHGRTHEGSGIGLALVQELVRLHGGSVAAESSLNHGSAFTVTLPLGRAHLPAVQIGAARTQASTALGATPFVDEALRWLPDGDPAHERVLPEIEVTVASGETPAERARILLADDNADMRDYVQRLLASRYDVETVVDGEEALAAIARQQPDLVLSDIMMPRLDGLQLLGRLRKNQSTSTIPVILLSARAGEESRVEGMHAGADDYLIKPFSGRELLARIEAHVKMARYRRDAMETLRASEERFRAFVTASSDAVYRMSPDWREMRHLQGKDFIPDTVNPNQGWLEKYIHPDDQTRVMAVITDAIRTKNIFELEHRVIRVDKSVGWTHARAIPIFDKNGEILEWFGAARDITERKQAEETRQFLLDELNHRVKNTLASVQAIAQQTLRRTHDPNEFVSSFGARIQSLARVHSLLSATNWHSADLRELVRDQLLHGSVDETRVSAVGPSLQLEAQIALHLAMILHELGTNAVKYGALSTPRGRVTVAWTMEDQMLRLQWQERGGPPARVPTKRGFGTTLIEQSAKGEGGAARMVVKAEGLSWNIDLPLRRSTHANGTSEAVEGRLNNEPTREQPSVVQKGTRKLDGKRFLVVEDEPLLALELKDGLTGEGAKVVASVGSPKEAFEAIENRQIDAALLDGNLNGQRVDEIAAALTRHNVPFVFVSGYGRDSLPNAFRDTALLNKPFSQAQLLDAAMRLIAPSAKLLSLRKR